MLKFLAGKIKKQKERQRGKLYAHDLSIRRHEKEEQKDWENNVHKLLTKCLTIQLSHVLQNVFGDVLIHFCEALYQAIITIILSPIYV